VFVLRILASRRNRARLGERGYSLLEVLIVLTIIALIAALVGPRLMAQLDRSKVTAARVQVRSLASAVETMRIDIGRYPTTQEGLALLVHGPSGRDSALWQGPYLDSDVPTDPWGGLYLYQAPGDDFARPRIASLGADGEEGGAGLAADVVHGDTP
jgi:general secretion pathway protein G